MSDFFFVVASFLAFYIFHFIIWRIVKKKKGVNLIVLLSIATFIGTYLLHFESLNKIFVVAPPFFFLVMLYLHWYTAIDRSLSVKILADMAFSKNIDFSLSYIEEHYLSHKMLNSRIELLVDKGLLKKEGENYLCTTKGKIFSKVTLFFQNSYRVKHAG